VLLAEHNRISRRLLSRMLARLGLQVCLADSVEEARQVFCRRPGEFVLVILDLKAPLDGGVEWLRQWPADAESRRVPVIALGIDPGVSARDACIEAGARIYLTEALRDERLGNAVRQLVDVAAREEPIPATAPAAPPEPEVQDDATLLNVEAFRSLLDLSTDPGFIQELMDDFRRDGSGYFARMQHALKKRDALEWHEALHALKGSAMGLGAKCLAQLCARHEDLSREALRAGEGYSEYAFILEVFNRTVRAMQVMAGERSATDEQAAWQVGA
jgi:two-component system, sensor histidine kinase RpfC